MKERESSSSKERTPTVNTKVEAVVPSPPGIESDTERGRKSKQKKKIATRFRTSVERGRDRTIATTHREAAPKRGQRRETACVPTCVDVGWRRRWRKTKQDATGEWNRPFSLRFPVFSRFRLLAVGMDATTKRTRDMAFTTHTHTQDGRDGREAPEM